MKPFQLLFMGFFVLATTGCAVSIKTDVSRFDSPEALGHSGRLEVSARESGESETELTHDYTVAKASPDRPNSIDLAFDPHLSGGIALIPGLDVIVRSNPVFEVKYQLLGLSRDQAKAGNFSLAASVGYGSASENNGTSGQGIFFPGPATIDVNTQLLDLGLIVGYRPGDHVLIYGGPFLTRSIYRVNQSINNGPTSYLGGSIRTLGTNLGVEIGKPEIFLRLEVGVFSTTAGSYEKTLGTAGLALGANFN